jgi:nitroimidazol reductase NimA-like FMN-containing flavoprotein (pyridoxamine 5'-phosphate oxidase superfamily)
MRRKDREIRDRQEIDEIMRGALVCHLALAVDGEPYVIPLSFGYDGTSLYLHTAAVGKKTDCLEANPRVCFAVERNVELVPDPADACRWTFAFESVIGLGRAVELTGVEEKRQAANQIMLHYSGREWPLDSHDLTQFRAWRIEIDELTGKRSPGEGAS